jgi:hypothetical protein
VARLTNAWGDGPVVLWSHPPESFACNLDRFAKVIRFPRIRKQALQIASLPFLNPIPRAVGFRRGLLEQLRKHQFPAAVDGKQSDAMVSLAPRVNRQHGSQANNSGAVVAAGAIGRSTGGKRAREKPNRHGGHAADV